MAAQAIDQTLAALTELLRSTPHDLLYFNSLFDPALSIRPALLRRLGRVERRPLVIAPRGEFARGALGFKSLRKRLPSAWVAIHRRSDGPQSALRTPSPRTRRRIHRGRNRFISG